MGIGYFPMDRRTFLMASTATLGGLKFGPPTLLAAPGKPAGGRKKPAISVILFFLCGGSSHIV